jgi:hypothetical protein
MPVAAFAASGHARALWSRRNAVERLGVGADGQVAAAWHPSHPPAAGGSIRDWGELCRAVLGCANRAPPKRTWPAGRSSS